MAAGVPFVDALAAGLLAEAGDRAEALADVVVLLPTRRACRHLADAFLRQTGGRALLLPRIEPLGEIDPDELLIEGVLDPGLPPAISPLRRQLLLARLLQPLNWPIEHALRLAGDLAALLDELQTERVDLGALDRLVPDELAGHWQKSRAVLAVIGYAWPELVAAEGMLDPAARRDRVLTALAARWRAAPPEARIVAAGSTGSIPATRAVLQAVAALPQGTVVLPGLDQELDEASWAKLEPGHPQYGLRQLLEALGVARSAVARWPAPGVAATDPARARLLGEVMRPVATIGAWQELPAPPPAALAGLHVERHPDLPGEALALALRMREALEVPGRTAALVTPDRHLARRVAVELGRWQIGVDDSAGTPLDQTPPGAFLLLCARLVVELVHPVTLLATLKHPLAQGGLDQRVFRRRARELELACLRGPRLVGGFAGVLAELDRARHRARDDARRERLTRLRAWADGLGRQMQPFAELAARREVELAALVSAHLAFAEALARDEQGSAAGLWAREAGEAAAALLTELLETSHNYRIAPGAYPALLARLMAARAVRPRAARHPRLFIWGELEGRLQHADLLLLGGLNEGVWPRTVDPGPWLNRTMRKQLGLPPIERRIGLSAHDFVQAASAREVVLSRAEKDAHGNPTVPSRWLVRLQTLLEARGSTTLRPGSGRFRDWTRQLDAVATVQESQPPPRPPVAARPRRLSVSDVGTWMSDPYELYAKRILKLRPLDALDADPGALDRGTIIHRALERFVKAYPETLPEGAEQRLIDIGRELFGAFAHQPQVEALWWPRFCAAARWVIAAERARRPGLAAVLAEVSGTLELAAPLGTFTLTARADRLERLPDGRITVIDYKTGALPERREVVAGRQPQLPLEAAMVAAGGFEGLEPSAVAELWFWQLKGDERGGAQRDAANRAPADLGAQARAGLARLVAHYDQASSAYPPVARPRVAWRRDYDHLARIGEGSG